VLVRKNQPSSWADRGGGVFLDVPLEARIHFARKRGQALPTLPLDNPGRRPQAPRAVIKPRRAHCLLGWRVEDFGGREFRIICASARGHPCEFHLDVTRCCQAVARNYEGKIRRPRRTVGQARRLCYPCGFERFFGCDHKFVDTCRVSGDVIGSGGGGIAGHAVPSYASIIWIRFLGRRRSRVALSAFAPHGGTGWLPERMEAGFFTHSVSRRKSGRVS